MKYRRFRLWFGICLLLWGIAVIEASQSLHAQPLSRSLPYLYLSPVPGAVRVSSSTTIAIRYAVEIEAQTLTPARFVVQGGQTGIHFGNVTLADDHMTVLFRPDAPFRPQETVSVHIAAGMLSKTGEQLEGITYSFSIAPLAPDIPPNVRDQSAVDWLPARSAPLTTQAPSPERRASAVILPADLPVMTASVTSALADTGYLFVAPFGWLKPALPSFLLIMENNGQPVYYQRMDGTGLVADFKQQPNGLLTYYYNNAFHALDASYSEVGTYKAGNGYTADVHDLIVLPNGHALLMAYDYQTVDMSIVVAGGLPNALVAGLIVQEIDTAGNVVFQWSSWDHFQITDTTEPLVGAAIIDYAHGNSIDLDADGNLLVSSRHMDEITKISRITGQIIWRLGGKQNQFTFTNDAPFIHQHDVRLLANGHLTLFDNRTGLVPQYSRPAEYILDAAAKTVTLVREYRNTPDTYAAAMGSQRRLSNGNMLIGWGSSTATFLTEVTPNGTKALELKTTSPYVSYRAFRSAWKGAPRTKPTLVVQNSVNQTSLVYSWNGATEVASYTIYGDPHATNGHVIAQQVKTGFETSTILSEGQSSSCFFMVVPLDKDGNQLQASDVVHNPACPTVAFPLIVY